jgi:hypothetical protein
MLYKAFPSGVPCCSLGFLAVCLRNMTKEFKPIYDFKQSEAVSQYGRDFETDNNF